MEIICNHSIKILKWKEDITLKTIKGFEEQLVVLINEPENKLMLDLSNVEYMNSAGLGVLVDSVMKARGKQKELVVAGVGETLFEIFNIVKIGTFIKLFSTEEEAITFFQSKENE